MGGMYGSDYAANAHGGVRASLLNADNPVLDVNQSSK